MPRMIWLPIAVAATILVCVLAVTDRLPLGVAGEWEWPRMRPAYWPEVALVAAGYVALVGVAARWLDRPWARRTLVAMLVAAAFAVPFAMQSLGEFGLAKWPFVLFSASSSGYYTAAKSHVTSPSEFIADYDRIQSEFLRDRGPYHLATHPPGLVLLHFEVLRWCESKPARSRAWLDVAPATVRGGFEALAGRSAAIPLADQASLWLVGLLSQLACALTVVPIYVLARRGAGARPAWFAAALWPLVPATTIFMPKSDVLYPLFATTAVAFALAGRATTGRVAGGLAAGLVLWLGMYFTFGLVTLLPLIIAAVVFTEGVRARPGLVACMQRGAAMLAAFATATAIYTVSTGHNLLATWLACFHAHAKFYDRHPRSYWSWVGFDLAEFVVAMGVPLAIAAIVGGASLARRRANSATETGERETTPGSNDADPTRCRGMVWAWCLTVLALDLSGKNLGEVARLWIFLMPFAIPAAAAALEQLGPRSWPAMLLLAAQAFQTFVFAANLQGFIDTNSVRMPEKTMGTVAESRSDASKKQLKPKHPWISISKWLLAQELECSVRAPGLFASVFFALLVPTIGGSHASSHP